MGPTTVDSQTAKPQRFGMTDKIDLSVIIPVYNEAATCAEIIKRVQAISIVYEIIVVDDASTDGTIHILETIDNIKVIILIFI